MARRVGFGLYYHVLTFHVPSSGKAGWVARRCYETVGWEPVITRSVHALFSQSN